MAIHISKKLNWFVIALLSVLFAGGCSVVKKESRTPTLLKTVNATREQLLAEVSRFAKVQSLRAKVDLKFEDNSFAQFGAKEVYRTADGDIVVQRPANIYLKVQAPLIKTDIAQMTSDGKRFRVAILQDGGNGSYRKFVLGTNDADYSRLQKRLDTSANESNPDLKKDINAFSNLRPQHFTDALLVRPVDESHVYTQSSTYLIEEDPSQSKKSPLRSVVRGYYLLDEYEQDGNQLRITRRFWFDRVGGIRLARQQLFDRSGEIVSDIVYGREGNLGDQPDYQRLPLEVLVIRPQDKYSLRITFQSPSAVTVGKNYPQTAFELQNTWQLDEIDLDKQLSQLDSNTGNNSETKRIQ
ncbi:MAG TPA: hypothetical protein VNK26_03610 [Pyrinomonadaceae bacterium]|jgi:hypothetical protein|nr:hypothetical protein [Pyrinomonadaceae bacterium]